MNAVSQILGALIEAWGEVKVQKARVVLSLVGVVAAVAAMTIVIALGDLLLQSSRELAELYEGRSVTLRLTPESSSNTSEGPATGGPYQDASDPASATGAQTAKRPDIHYWSRFSSGGGEIVETRQARASGQFRGYPLTKIGDMIDGVAFQGVDPSYAVIYRTRMLAGRWVESSDADQRLIPVVISQSLWDQLGRAPIDQVPIVLHTSDGVAMRVVGVTKSKSSYDMPTVFAHYDAARVSFPQMTSQAMIAWVGTENADQARENLPRALASILGEGWRVSVSGGEHEDIGEEQLGTISNVIMVIGGIIVFLGALGLLNVAIVTVRQRVREIGIRRARLLRGLHGVGRRDLRCRRHRRGYRGRRRPIPAPGGAQHHPERHPGLPRRRRHRRRRHLHEHRRPLRHRPGARGRAHQADRRDPLLIH